MAEEIFIRCINRQDGKKVAAKLAKLYVLIHFKLDYQSYISEENHAIFLKLASNFLMYIESDLTQTDGRHAALLSAIFLTDDQL